MILIGAARHAKEILQILEENKIKVNYLFDNVSDTFDSYFENFNIIKNANDNRIQKCQTFSLGLGGTIARKKLYYQFLGLGLKPSSIISSTSKIGIKEVNLGKGINVMHFVFISENVSIGNGTLINAYASIHHDVRIGEFSEVSPRATLLGGAHIGNGTTIGSGAIILPDVKIGSNSIIGAGSIVTKSIDNNELWYGNPAKFIKKLGNEN